MKSRSGQYIIIWYVIMLLVISLLSACEKRDFEEAKGVDTVEAYQAFLEKYPKGDLATEARQKALDIIEREAITNLIAIRDCEEAYKAKARAELKRRSHESIVKLIPSSLAYDGSEISIHCEGLAYAIWLSYQDGEWQLVDSDEITKVKSGKIMIMGKVRAGNTLPEGVAVGSGSLTFGYGGVPTAGPEGVNVLMEKALQIEAEPSLYVECQSSPPTGGADDKPDEWTDAGGFQDIGFEPNTPVRYQYAVAVGSSGDTFEATAIGDMDGNGVMVTYTITDGSPDPVKHPGDEY